MKVAVQKLPKNTVVLTITVSTEEIKKSQDRIWDDIVKNAEIDGFRKGNAPLELVQQRVDPGKVQTEVISDVIKTYYPLALEEQKLSPVIAPKIELEEFDPEKDFNFTATTALQPVITVGDYKKAIKEVYDKKSAAPKNPTENGSEHGHIHLTPNEITDAILSVTTYEISDLLVEEEANKMLSRLINQVQTLKMDMDAYLKSQNKTAETVKAEYAQIAQRSIAGELALIEVVKKEGIEATEEEVEQTLAALGDPKLKDQYGKDEYQKAYIKSIISKNKVIWKLSSPENEDHSHEAEEHPAKPDAKKEESDAKN